MHKALHPWDEVDRLYVSRKEGGRGPCIQERIGKEWLENYMVNLL